MKLPDIEVMSLDDILDELADYADLEVGALQKLDARSMRVALLQKRIYESKQWVDEYLEIKPPPKSGPSLRRFAPDSKNRFHGWLTTVQARRGRHSYMNRHCYRLFDVADVVEAIPDLKLSPGTTLNLSEKRIRPLVWMQKHGYGNRINEVWTMCLRAVEHDSTLITEAIVKDCLSQWRALNVAPSVQDLPKSKQKAIAADVLKARRDKQIILDKLQEMLDLAAYSREAQDEVRDLLNQIKAEVLKANQEAAA